MTLNDTWNSVKAAHTTTENFLKIRVSDRDKSLVIYVNYVIYGQETTEIYEVLRDLDVMMTDGDA
uniref:Uncharacterized protein n=1 Tax=Megaselia scalaris TaxID=36166 RepID=T1H0V3_MEGSC